ncbi:type VII secretion integral membrane protein EccD [Actinoplanes sp. L3-i22]|uniref:type VII secretion integral membrane protein EccD n=1 Tax=Actinoplanes sp. L3-i22 TaxID=2836373 RepID=UPI001C78ECAB|nr:type VII secretion integral membrane protein EccD [Actinoplanes sp. L3-i22]BCY07237.1 hypothetical protein L3i22_023250 [Actinoplanes sp. L3-i22]
MTTATETPLCRITVTGPQRRADLAVPPTVTVAALLPVLLRHTSDGTGGSGDGFEGAWVLQRLGEPPFALSGTPESLDWLEGEELYLRPAEDPLPELDFDDVAEGMATIVNRRPDRWQPEHRRPLFVILSAVVMALVAAVLTARGPALAQVIAAGVVAVIFTGAALVCARRVPDGLFALLFGFGAAAFAGLGAARAVPDDYELLGASVAVLAVSGLLLLAQRTVTPHMPYAPMLVLGLTALVATLLLLVGIGSVMSAAQTAALGVTVFAGIVVVSPRVAVKLARLRGPQLPKTGADMAYDVEPAPSDVVRDRTNEADTYLTVTMVTTALLVPVLFHLTLREPGWTSWAYVVIMSAALLLRARAFFGLWQRLGLTLAGGAGSVLAVLRLADLLPGASWWILPAVLLGLIVPLVMAAMRPWSRRMLPFWEYTATFFDVATGVAALPVLAHLLGLYAWARGLFG